MIKPGFFILWQIKTKTLKHSANDAPSMRQFNLHDENILISYNEVGRSHGYPARSTPNRAVQRPVSRKPREVFGSVKPFLDHLYLKTEKCIRLKLPVLRELPFIFRMYE